MKKDVWNQEKLPKSLLFGLILSFVIPPPGYKTDKTLAGISVASDLHAIFSGLLFRFACIALWSILCTIGECPKSILTRFIVVYTSLTGKSFESVVNCNLFSAATSGSTRISSITEESISVVQVERMRMIGWSVKCIVWRLMSPNSVS